MILLSLVLVIAAAVLLVVGWFQDGLALIYLSIGACLLSMLLLGASVLLRRRAGAPAVTSAGAAAPASATSGRPAVARPSTTVADSSDATASPATPAADDASDATASPAMPAADDASDAGPEESADAVAPSQRPSRRAAVVRRSASTEESTDEGSGPDDTTPVPDDTSGRDDTTSVPDDTTPAPDDTTPEPTTAAAPDAGDPLGSVRGLGPSRREALLARFGDVDAIRSASLDELTEVAGMTPALAESVKEQLDRS